MKIENLTWASEYYTDVGSRSGWIQGMPLLILLRFVIIIIDNDSTKCVVSSPSCLLETVRTARMSWTVTFQYVSSVFYTFYSPLISLIQIYLFAIFGFKMPFSGCSTIVKNQVIYHFLKGDSSLGRIIKWFDSTYCHLHRTWKVPQHHCSIKINS